MVELATRGTVHNRFEINKDTYQARSDVSASESEFDEDAAKTRMRDLAQMIYDTTPGIGKGKLLGLIASKICN